MHAPGRSSKGTWNARHLAHAPTAIQSLQLPRSCICACMPELLRKVGTGHDLMKSTASCHYSFCPLWIFRCWTFWQASMGLIGACPAARSMRCAGRALGCRSNAALPAPCNPTSYYACTAQYLIADIFLSSLVLTRTVAC